MCSKYDTSDPRSMIKDYTPVNAPPQLSHSYHDEEFEAWPINAINQASADILIYSH